MGTLRIVFTVGGRLRMAWLGRMYEEWIDSSREYSFFHL